MIWINSLNVCTKRKRKILFFWLLVSYFYYYSLQQYLFFIHYVVLCVHYIVPSLLVCIVCSTFFCSYSIYFLSVVHMPNCFPKRGLYPLSSLVACKNPVTPIESLFYLDILLSYVIHKMQFLLRFSVFCTLKCHVM